MNSETLCMLRIARVRFIYDHMNYEEEGVVNARHGN